MDRESCDAARIPVRMGSGHFGTWPDHLSVIVSYVLSSSFGEPQHIRDGVNYDRVLWSVQARARAS